MRISLRYHYGDVNRALSTRCQLSSGYCQLKSSSGGSRTHKRLPSEDFKSSASASSATEPYGRLNLASGQVCDHWANSVRQIISILDLRSSFATVRSSLARTFAETYRFLQLNSSMAVSKAAFCPLPSVFCPLPSTFYALPHSFATRAQREATRTQGELGFT